MVDDVWATDRAVLGYIMDESATMKRGEIGARAVAEAVEVTRDVAVASLGRLYRATPPFLEPDYDAMTMADEVAPVLRVTERGLREVGAWPTAESFADRLVARLDEAADREPDPERKSKLKETARYLGGAARDVVVDFAATYAARQAGM